MRPNRFHIFKKIRYDWINTTEMIASIGGAFGVLIGFSMIIFFEIPYFCFVLTQKKKRINELRKNREDISIQVPLRRYFAGSEIVTERKKYYQKFDNKIDRIQQKTQIFILKQILNRSLNLKHRLAWITVTIALFLCSILCVHIIWFRSYADPLIVSLSNTRIPTSMVSHLF